MRIIYLIKSLLLIIVLLPGSLMGHGFDPAVLNIMETPDKSYMIHWQSRNVAEFSESSDLKKLHIIWPQDCASDIQEDNSDYFLLSCISSLEGKIITISGLSWNKTDAMISVRYLDGTQFSTVLTQGEESLTLPLKIATNNQGKPFFFFGISHILQGYDHLLFILLLVLMFSGLKSQIKALTAFTLGHSMSLSLATLGIFSLPPSSVEVLIAFTIFYTAYKTAKSSPINSSSYKLYFLPAFFGFIHGFGFAAALSEYLNLKDSIFVPLLSFNLGIESGQILVISSLFILTKVLFNAGFNNIIFNRLVRQSTTYFGGSLAVFWMISRLNIY